MGLTPKKRKEMEDLIYTVFTALDPSGTNTAKYKTMFSGMTDAQFDKFFKNLFANDDLYLILDIISYERELTIEQIENAAKILNIPLMEKVAMPFSNGDPDNPVITKYEVPVGYIHIKRMQQILSKKNTTSTDISKRSALTGQVVDKDKNARISDQETFSLITINATDSLRELLGGRADDTVMKTEMYSEISKKGYVSIDELTDNPNNKTTLNTVDVHLLGMGIKSDLVTKTLALNKTLQEK